MLEASLYSDNAFVSLSYADQHLSFDSDDSLNPTGPSLVPRHVQLFLKRLRKAVAPRKFRFFLVGEYGDRNERPHYHLALFDFPTCRRGRTLRLPPSTRSEWALCCPECRLVGENWGLGDVDLGVLEKGSAGYVAGYVLKKMTRKTDERLGGRYPEFARMSLRPGIGYGVLQHIAGVLLGHGLDEKLIDVPVVLRHGREAMPLGRYLRRKLRLLLDREETCPQVVIDELQEEMRDVREAAKKLYPSAQMAPFRKEAIKTAIIDANLGIKWKYEHEQSNRKKRDIA